VILDQTGERVAHLLDAHSSDGRLVQGVKVVLSFGRLGGGETLLEFTKSKVQAIGASVRASEINLDLIELGIAGTRSTAPSCAWREAGRHAEKPPCSSSRPRKLRRADQRRLA